MPEEVVISSSTPVTDGSRRSFCMTPFYVWLAGFYTVWLILVASRDLWSLVAEHWGIAAAMAAGSYFAGSTPMGGGTVGFPVLVLLFQEPATLGRDFSFAVQSIGMTSASIFVLCRRQHLEWTMLRWALFGSLIGTPLGVLFIAPLIPALGIKVFFAVIWASFGVLHFWKLNEIAAIEGILPGHVKFDRRAGLLIGLVGGSTAAAITGVGIDMLIYAVLVLVCRADLKIAIPTSVILMAATSLIGLATKLTFSTVSPELFGNWLAAAPVVALGAPFGALIVDKIGRKPTLLVVSFLCLGQFVWTMFNERDSLNVWGYAGAVLGVVIFNLVFAELYRMGDRMKRRKA